MTLLKTALIAAVVAISSPALASSFTGMPYMPTLTYPSDGAFAPATKNSAKLVETCADDSKTCTKAIEDLKTTRKTPRGE